jgi:hemerythrin superfamily protein
MQHTEHAQHRKHKSTATHARRSTSTSTAKRASPAKKNDVLSLLSEDHKHVLSLFKEFEKLRGHKNSDDKKKQIVQQICVDLTIHAKAEEEFFYPAARQVIKDQEITDEAYVEHSTAKELIQQLQTMRPSDDYYDAKVLVLQEYISHHIKEEEEKIFPAMKKAKMDLESLGEEVAHCKQELQGDLAEVSMSMLSKA